MFPHYVSYYRHSSADLARLSWVGIHSFVLVLGEV